MNQEPELVAIYMRVSSDDQRDRETIKTQRDAIERFLTAHPEYQPFRWYEDDGISGTIPLAKRPQGAQLLADATAGRFTKVIVLRASRLGREEADLFTLYNLFEALNIELIGVAEQLNDRMIFGVQSIMAAYARRQFLADSARGMDRAAREGRYCGGIVPLGYRVEGHKQTARLVPDENLIWADWSAAELVSRIYKWLAVEGKSSRWIAQELNRLGVPTSYKRDGRGVRGRVTQGIWRPGRIYNMVRNPIYKGDFSYGRRRSKKSKRTELITSTVPALVTAQLWAAGQATLAANRLAPRNTRRIYLLRSVIKCGLCNLAFCGAKGRDGVWWYRCDGYMAERGPKEHRCLAKSIKNTVIEPVVWNDIVAFIRDPGPLLAQLQEEIADKPDEDALQAQQKIATLDTALADLEPRRQRLLGLFERGKLSDSELDERLDQVTEERRDLEARRNAIVLPELPEDPVPVDLMAALAERLEEGALSDAQRNEIVRLLVKQITVYTTLNERGGRDVRLVIEYRFSSDWCSQNANGTVASQNYTNLRRVVYV